MCTAAAQGGNALTQLFGAVRNNAKATPTPAVAAPAPIGGIARPVTANTPGQGLVIGR